MFEGYEQLADGLFATPAAAGLIGRLDTIILDIDGVILNVTASFRRAICLTTQFYFEEYLKWPAGPTLIEPKETQAFKLAGGFNNDWELTYAVILFYLARSQVTGSKDLAILRGDGRPLIDFTKELKRLGGGLKTANRLIAGTFAASERINELWNRSIIKQIFQEIYAGTDHCKEIYGFDPAFIFGKGLLNEEKVLIDRSLVASFSPKVGVITGRTTKEAELALERAALSELVKKGGVIADDGGRRKPDPTLIVELSEFFETQLGVYIGDTLDDLLTVNNFKALDRSETFLSCIVSSDPKEAAWFTQKGVDILTDSADRLLLEAKARAKNKRERD
ncbi:MAG: hypothetical protein QMD53_00045 [Actinomycetota bacterium]|nr:hypothetical protein [Actinomycetota bacterium]